MVSEIISECLHVFKLLIPLVEAQVEVATVANCSFGHNALVLRISVARHLINIGDRRAFYPMFPLEVQSTELLVLTLVLEQ